MLSVCPRSYSLWPVSCCLLHWTLFYREHCDTLAPWKRYIWEKGSNRHHSKVTPSILINWLSRNVNFGLTNYESLELYTANVFFFYWQNHGHIILIRTMMIPKLNTLLQRHPQTSHIFQINLWGDIWQFLAVVWCLVFQLLARVAGAWK